MTDQTVPGKKSGYLSFTRNFVVIFASFCLLTLLSWPILLSLDLWVFEDRASFLHLDKLLADHYRLGVDVFYSYGLLPVLLQHLVFLLFGRGYKPMLGCTLLVLIMNALFWAALLEHLQPQRRWLVSVAVLSPLILIVNPNWPYSLAVLSIMFALHFVLEERLDIALAVSAVGCFCVPSLTLVLTILLVLTIVFNWFFSTERSVRRLAFLLLPGLTTYALLATMLGLFFGWDSLAATALPLNGARFYKEAGYSGFSAFLTFLHPAGYGFKYYLAYYTGSPVTWFVLCSLFLFVFATISLAPLLKGRPLSAPVSFVVLYSVLQFVFIFFIYGPRGQHVLYEGVLAAASLIGISTLSAPRHRNIALGIFVAVGILGETGAAYKTFTAWRTTVPSPQTFGLYADPTFAEELARVVEISKTHKTLMLGYATGIQSYYPTLEDPIGWVLQKGQLFDVQKQAIARQIRRADIVVEVLTSQSPVVNSDPGIQEALNEMHVASAEKYFRIHTR